jgi:hypothetical protein
MIGFSVQIRTYDDKGEETHRTALLSLDVDDPDCPELDIRLADGSLLAVMANVKEAWEAITEVNRQLNTWEREHQPEAVS